MNIIFAGTPEFAAKSLWALLSSDHKVVAVYTQPDRPAGRGRQLHMSEVKTAALDAGIPCQQPTSLKDPQALDTLQQYQADLMVVVAYGLLLPASVLNSFPLGCINVHASLLPHWRGAAPIQRAIAAGDAQTGITLMQMDEGLDTGAMLSSRRIAITPDETGGTLHDKLADAGASLLLDTLPQIEQRTLAPIPQNHSNASYAHKLTKKEAQLDWEQPAQVLNQQIRAFNPWPVAYTQAGDTRIRIWGCAESAAPTTSPAGTIIGIDKSGITIATGSGTLTLTKLQLPGGKQLPCHALLNAPHEWLKLGFQLG